MITFAPFIFYLAMALSVTGATLAIGALNALPQQPHAAKKMLALGLVLGLVSITIRLVSAFT